MKTICFLVMLVALTAIGQNTRKIDSLERILAGRIPDSAKCRIMGVLFDECIRTDKKKARLYNIKSLQLAKSCGYKRGLAGGYYDQAVLLKYEGKNDSAIVLQEISGALYLEVFDTIGYLRCLAETGTVYIANQDYQHALESFLEAEKGFVKKNDWQDLSRIYSQMGSMFKVQKQDAEALKYHLKSLKINEDINFKMGISVNLNNIGNIYQEKGSYDSALYFYTRALKMKELLGDKLGIARIMNNLGQVYLYKGDISKAIQYHLKALDYNLETKNKKDLAINHCNLGYDYLKAGNYTKASYHANQGLSLAITLHDLNVMSEAYKILSEAATGKGDSQNALKYFQLHKQYFDSVINEKNLKTIAEIRTRYDAVKNEKEIAELNSDKREQELRLETIKANRNLYLSLFIGVVFVLVAVYTRIRHRRKLEVHLREMDEMKSKFFAELSHEFRTPLSLMLGPVEQLLGHASPEDREMLEIVERNARRILNLDEQLLELTKLETGNRKLSLVTGDVSIILKGIAASYQSLAERKQIRYSCDIAMTETTAIFDPDILEKIISNLLTNAFKFTPEGGSVSVRSLIKHAGDLPERKLFAGKKDSRYILIEVKDSGIGIPEAFHDKVFDRFFQVSKGSGLAREGTGIGLALTKELVGLNHGLILLTSKESQGSDFLVFLPCDMDGYSPEEIAGVPAYKEKPGAAIRTSYSAIIEDSVLHHQAVAGESELVKGFRKILVVEDNPDMRRYLWKILSDFYTIIEAVDGEEGYRTACEHHPDLIITDLMMPGTDGLQFCRKLKEEECTSHIPVIMLTALASTEDKVTGLETGADDYIAKPFNNSELIARIKNLLLQRDQLRHLFSTAMKLQPGDVTVTPVDERFLQRLIKSIEDQIDNPEIDIDYLTRSANMSRSQLHQKLKALTGMPATGFVKIIRLKRAASLMEQNFGNVSDIAYAVGFANLSYFSKCFREVYKVSPSDYLAGISSATAKQNGHLEDGGNSVLHQQSV